MEWTREISQALLKPFPDEMIEVREGKFFYVDARAVMSRLDEAVGAGNWSFRCRPVPHQIDGQIGAVVKGTLTVLGVTREDIGEHWRAGDRDKVEVYKSAASDALKRAAVHFGIGRYLYELEVARAGKMTQAEKEAAARKVGYAPSPEIHDFPCSVCGADVDIDLARKCQRTYGGRVFCVKHKAELDEGIKAQAANPIACDKCGVVLDERIANASIQALGFGRCYDCAKLVREAKKVKETVNA